MTTNHNFPLSTPDNLIELPLRRAGWVAVLLGQFDDKYIGVLFDKNNTNAWAPSTWELHGARHVGSGPDDYDILPPRQKFWVVWDGQNTKEATLNKTRAENWRNEGYEVTEHER